MAELYTFNKDNTYRLFLVPVTSKARIYRLVREVSKLVLSDQMIGFSYTSIMTINHYKDNDSLKELYDMTSDQRIQIGVDHFISYSYQDGKTYARSITKEDSIFGKKPIEMETKQSIFNPLIAHISASELIFDEQRLNTQDDTVK